MAAEISFADTHEVGDALPRCAQLLAVAEHVSCELECHAMLISLCVNKLHSEKGVSAVPGRL